MEASSNILLILRNYENIINELNNYESIHLNNAKNALKNILSEAEALRKVIEEQENRVKAKDKELKELEEKLNKLNDKLTQLKTLREKKLKEKTQLEEENSNLTSEVKNYEGNFKSLEKACRELERKVRDEQEKLESLQRNLNNLKTEIEKENNVFRGQLERELNELNKIKALHKAVKYLIENKMLKTPEYAIIEALAGKSTLSLDYIQKTTLTKIEVVKNVVKALEKRGLLELNEATGQIKILKQLMI